MSPFHSRFSILDSSPRGGQALVEVLIAVSVLAVGFLGIVTLLSRALSLNRVIADNYTATYLAAEGIEIAKNIIDSNLIQKKPWNEGVSGSYEVDYESLAFTESFDESDPRHLLYDPSAHAYSYSGTLETPFVREVRLKPDPDGMTEIQVNSVVTWSTRGGGVSSIDLEDHFYNWR